jgi:hypothetical protein
MDRPKGGRHPQVSRQVEYRIKTILKESNHGCWTTKKQVEEMIIQESGVRYHHNYIYRISQVGLTEGTKEGSCTLHPQKKRRMISKKGQSDTYGYAIPKERFYPCIFR